MWQPFITENFHIHSRSLQSFSVGKSFIPQDIEPCALYYYIIDESAH